MPRRSGGMTAQQIDALLAESWQEPEYDYLWFYRQFGARILSPLAQLRWLDLNTDLAEGLLTKVDRTSMAHSLEVRPPLLDHRLVEFMLSVDPAAAGRSAAAARQIAGAAADGAAIAAGSFESAEIRLWSAGASLAEAPPAGVARRGAAPDGSRRVAASGGKRISPRLVPPGVGSLVHRLCD